MSAQTQNIPLFQQPAPSLHLSSTPSPTDLQVIPTSISTSDHPSLQSPTALHAMEASISASDQPPHPPIQSPLVQTSASALHEQDRPTPSELAVGNSNIAREEDRRLSIFNTVVAIVGLVVAIACGSGAWAMSHSDARDANYWAKLDTCYNHPEIQASDARRKIMAAGQDDLTKRELQPARMLNFVGISRYLDSIRTKVSQFVTSPALTLTKLPIWIGRPLFALLTLPVLLQTFTDTEDTYVCKVVVLLIYGLIVWNDMVIGGTNAVSSIFGVLLHLGGHWIGKKYFKSSVISTYLALIGVIGGISLIPFWVFFAWKATKTIQSIAFSESHGVRSPVALQRTGSFWREIRNVHSTRENALSISEDGFCGLCSQFAKDIQEFNFKPQETYGPRWKKKSNEDGPWGDSFRHYDNVPDFQRSVLAGCKLCCMISAGRASDWWEKTDNRLIKNRVTYQYQPVSGDGPGELVLYPFLGKFIFTFRWTGDGAVGFMGYPRYPFSICQARAWSREDETRPGVYPVTKRLYWREVPIMGNDDDCFATAKTWLDHCLMYHGTCGRPIQEDQPSRLIQVSGANPRVVSLLETHGLRYSYTVLSHCWGGVVGSITTKANYEHRKHVMHLDDLSANFRDAIFVTRRLGINYLWVDSLCIIQDDKTDWAREASKMAGVYAGAVVTISALRAKSCDEGFLGPRLAGTPVPLPSLNNNLPSVSVRRNLVNLHDAVVVSKLHSRGWVFQERMMSTALLHFSHEQMFWECRYGWFSECGGSGDRRGESPLGMFRPRPEFSYLRSATAPKAPLPEPPFTMWYYWVEEYTRKELTFDGDKLPAMAGLADIFGRSVPGNYVAGLWQEDLINGLLWSAARDIDSVHILISESERYFQLKSPSNRKSPSWSWLAVDGPVKFFAPHLRPNPKVYFRITQLPEPRSDSRIVCGPIRLGVRGLVAKMVYMPSPKNENVGLLTLAPLKDDGFLAQPRISNEAVMHGIPRECLHEVGRPALGLPESEQDLIGCGCVLDVAPRGQPRRCYGILAMLDLNIYHVIVLAKLQAPGEEYIRIGYCAPPSGNGWSRKDDHHWFEEKDIGLW